MILKADCLTMGFINSSYPENNRKGSKVVGIGDKIILDHMLLIGSWNGKKLAIAVEFAVWEVFWITAYSPDCRLC